MSRAVKRAISVPTRQGKVGVLIYEVTGVQAAVLSLRTEEQSTELDSWIWDRRVETDQGRQQQWGEMKYCSAPQQQAWEKLDRRGGEQGGQLNILFPFCFAPSPVSRGLKLAAVRSPISHLCWAGCPQSCSHPLPPLPRCLPGIHPFPQLQPLNKSSSSIRGSTNQVASDFNKQMTEWTLQWNNSAESSYSLSMQSISYTMFRLSHQGKKGRGVSTERRWNFASDKRPGPLIKVNVYKGTCSRKPAKLLFLKTVR